MIFRELGKNKKIINSIIGIWTHLNEIRRKQLFSLFLLMILSGFSEMLSIAAVIPFLGVLTDPSKLLKVETFITVAKLKKFSSNTMIDGASIKKDGYKQLISTERGIEETIDWIKKESFEAD